MALLTLENLISPGTARFCATNPPTVAAQYRATSSLKFSHALLVDPALVGLCPGYKLLRLEPQSNLLVGRLDRIRAVDDIPGKGFYFRI